MMVIMDLFNTETEVKEFSFLDEKKKNAEFITPEVLRKWIAVKIGRVNTVFDCSVGSGQLLQFIECDKKLGNDINERAIEFARSNGIECTLQDYITYDDTNITYDVAISNYPFSLKPTSEQAEHIRFNYPFLCNNQGKFVGVLDSVFISKSFLKASKGFYLAFPGITYRRQEFPFRKWLLDNRFIKSVGLLNNCGFKDTNISLLFLELDKGPQDSILFFIEDIKNNTIKSEVVAYDNIEDCDISVSKYIDTAPPKEKIDIKAVEQEINDNFEKTLEAQLKLDLFLYEEGFDRNILIKLKIMRRLLKEYSDKVFEGE